MATQNIYTRHTSFERERERERQTDRDRERELDRPVLLYLYNINGAGQVRVSAFSPEKRKFIKCHDTFNLVILILISHAKRA